MPVRQRSGTSHDFKCAVASHTRLTALTQLTRINHFTCAGDYFGELSLLTRAPRAATVKAVDEG
eukprot:SAG11_NODE_7487_length_1137_cov_2.184008_1_plen_63_part_10